MINKITSALLVLIIGLTTIHAQELEPKQEINEHNFYVIPKFYLVIADSDYWDLDTTGGVGVAMGYQFGPDQQFALEGEIAYTGWEEDYGYYHWYMEDHLDVYPFLFSLKWAPKISDRFRIFISPTVGVTYIHRKHYYYKNYWDWNWRSKSDDSWEFTYGGSIGIQYDFTDQLSLDVGYRFLIVDSDDQVKAHLPSIGLKVSF